MLSTEQLHQYMLERFHVGQSPTTTDEFVKRLLNSRLNASVTAAIDTLHAHRHFLSDIFQFLNTPVEEEKQENTTAAHQ